MKKINSLVVIIIIMAITLLNSCQKDLDSPDGWQDYDSHDHGKNHGHFDQTKAYSSEVALKWMDMELYLLRKNPVGGTPAVRYYAYGSIALYESVVPGMPAFRSLSGQLTDLPAMPETHRGYEYYWPECGNAALAAITRSFFPNVSAADKASIDSLENALSDEYQLHSRDDVFLRSAEFGKAVAQIVYDWSQTDGSSSANAPYLPPTDPGLWVPTPPAFLPAFGPYWGKNRLMVPNSLDGAAPLAPPVYSTDSSSEYYKMVKEVYDISQTLTSEQTAIALFFRDGPGYGGGHYLSILKQVLVQEDPQLDFTAYVFAKVSIAMVDAGIDCFANKFQYNQERPVTFIRNVLGFDSWTSLIPAPNFPDFPSAHSANAGAFVQIMEGFFGYNYKFTDHTYDYLGMAPRSYNSFYALGKEIGDARVFGGIHNRISCDRGLLMGRKIGRNVNKSVNFINYRYWDK